MKGRYSSQLLLLLLTGPPCIARADIRLPHRAPACVAWAAADLRSTLAHLRIDPTTVEVEVRIDAPVPRTPSDTPSIVEEQTFTLTTREKKVLVVAGGEVGAMYGLQELGEQLATQSNVTWAQAVRHLRGSTQRPYLEIRADNPFIHVYPIQLNDLAMWRGYIDMLARNRFNLLDMHGAYDLETTSFPNLYPQLIEVPGYPRAGGFSAAYRARNLVSFKAIVAYAKTRGVLVSFMNYSANDNKGGIYKMDPNVTNIPAAQLADYTAKAVTLLIQQLPGLYMLGFRVGESMQPASFYKDAYIKGVNDANRFDLRLYTRSWQTTKEQLEPIAQAAHHGFDIEIKFNGEHLGLPYQAMQGATYGSYSYQEYLDVPARYHIIWQIRANGTHRFWVWENSDFIRRTVQACRLGDARGFTLEPHIAYFDVHPEKYYRSAKDAAVYRYMWQKHWMWYYAWGRLGYDPELDEAHLIAQYTRHFGAAGATVCRAMQSSGRIVSLAYAYRFVGPDQRDFSPETETGNFDSKVKRSRQDLLQFAENKPEDERTFVGIDAFVSNKLEGKPDGRYGPYAVANLFQAAADQTRLALSTVPVMAGHQADEYRLLKADLLSSTYLADYYVHRIHAMTDLDFALHTREHSLYLQGEDELARSRSAWKQLSEVGDATYKPLSNPLRKQTGFRWSGELDRLARLDATASNLWETSRLASHSATLQLNLTDEGDNAGLMVRGLRETNTSTKASISCRVGGDSSIAAVILWWKPLPSEVAWQAQPMTLGRDGTYTTQIPLDRHGAMYLVEVQDTYGNAKSFPDELVETPYRVIPAFP